MTHSMTAFGRMETETDWGRLTWEARSVNHRYLEMSLRLPEELRGIEPLVRELIGKRLGRGKIDCNLRFQPGKAAAPRILLDQAMVRRLVDAAGEISASAPGVAPLRVIDVLGWPGVIKTPDLDVDRLGKAALDLLGCALDEVVHARAAEGERLREFIVQRLDAMEKIVAGVRTLLPEVVQAFRERLENRLAEIRQQLDPARLEQEIVLFAQRSDVDEELDRLSAHLVEIRGVLNKEGMVGRRLDFLMQELNREANTLGSKSADTRMINAAVELKVLIEQVREQVQNIE